MVHSITVKTDTKEILSKCKVASAGSDAQSRCAWIVCKRVSKRSKKTGSALQGSSPCLSILRKAIRSLGASHRYVASRNDGEKLIFVVISKNVRQHSRLVANSISEVLDGFTGNAITESSSTGRAVFEKCVNKTLTAITLFARCIHVGGSSPSSPIYNAHSNYNGQNC